jgi:hypothetical protein
MCLSGPGTICWLLSDECSFSTGAVFDISGRRTTYQTLINVAGACPSLECRLAAYAWEADLVPQTADAVDIFV